jgi:hypothetical protein
MPVDARKCYHRHMEQQESKEGKQEYIRTCKSVVRPELAYGCESRAETQKLSKYVKPQK